jgi:hypothetical protein
MDALLTTTQAADALGISRRRVRQLADALGLGIRVGQVRGFTAADIAAMRARPGRGRPALPPAVCPVDGCGATVRARGLCSKCYQAERRRLQGA